MAKILVIDDEEQIRDFLKTMLEIENHSVLEAQDGEQGLNILAKSPIDLVITDILMPNKEGFETIMEIQEKYPQIKIIAISGGGLHLDPDKYLNMAKLLNVVDVLRKPFERIELIKIINRLLQ